MTRFSIPTALFISTVFLNLTACNNSDNGQVNNKATTPHVDSSNAWTASPANDSNCVVLKGDTLSPDSYWSALFQEKLNGRPTDLSAEEINEIDKLTSEFIVTNRITLLSPQKYKRQYFPALTDKGEKVIWVNYFCSDHIDYWKNQIVIVMDGGNCFFQITINLTTKKISNFSINGLA